MARPRTSIVLSRLQACGTCTVEASRPATCCLWESRIPDGPHVLCRTTTSENTAFEADWAPLGDRPRLMAHTTIARQPSAVGDRTRCPRFGSRSPGVDLGRIENRRTFRKLPFEKPCWCRTEARQAVGARDPSRTPRRAPARAALGEVSRAEVSKSTREGCAHRHPPIDRDATVWLDSAAKSAPRSHRRP